METGRKREAGRTWRFGPETSPPPFRQEEETFAPHDPGCPEPLPGPWRLSMRRGGQGAEGRASPPLRRNGGRRREEKTNARMNRGQVSAKRLGKLPAPPTEAERSPYPPLDEGTRRPVTVFLEKIRSPKFESARDDERREIPPLIPRFPASRGQFPRRRNRWLGPPRRRDRSPALFCGVPGC